MMKISARILLATGFFLNACGGGGGGGGATSPPPTVPPPPPPPAALTGQFKDANVEGLAYSTASQSGTTGQSGTFTYRSGETVQFSLGGVIIGSATAQPVLTPVDLVPGGSSDDTEVRNIVRFLLLLDQDNDPSNGIRVSQAVRDVAASWAQVDFSTGDLASELVTVISDIASVDSRTPTLPSTQAARMHLDATMYCLASGYFHGTFGGSRDGAAIVLLANPLTGMLEAIYAGAPEEFNSIAPVTVDQQREFLLSTPAGDTLEGRFDSYDGISGVWSIGGDSGPFTAARVLPDNSASYRFVGQWFRNVVTARLVGPLVFNVDAQGNIDIHAHDTLSGNVYPGSGSSDGQSVSIEYDAGTTASGVIDPSLHISGTGSNPNGEARPWFAQGCRLN